MKILHINTSPRRAASHSSQLANKIVAGLLEKHPDSQVRFHDFGQSPHPLLDEAALNAIFTPAAQRTPEQAARVALDDAMIAEVQAADIIVLGVPMYNLTVPAQLKHWIDAISRAQVTFKFTEQGPVGLLHGKKVYVAFARGGIFRDTPADSQTPYLRGILGLLGMHDVHFVYAEGLNMGLAAEQAGLASAYIQIEAALTN